MGTRDKSIPPQSDVDVQQRFDWKSYVAMYPDLKRAIHGKEEAFGHWVRHGQYEGRCGPIEGQSFSFSYADDEATALKQRFAGNRIPVVLAIDVEPDEQFFDPATPPGWDGYKKAFRFFRKIRPLIAKECSGAHFSWFFRTDRQVADTYGSGSYVLDKHRRYLRHLTKAGDEIGVHTHAHRFDPSLGQWILDYASQDWVDHCVSTSFQSFGNAVGEPPRSHRFGDRWMNEASLAGLEQRGILFEMTLEPGFRTVIPEEMKKEMRGDFPDMTDVPSHPFFSASDDLRKEDHTKQQGIWSIPLSTGVVASAQDGAEYVVTLNLSCDPHIFRTLADRILQTQKPYFGLILRTDAFNHPYMVKNCRANIDYFITHPAHGCFDFCSPETAMRTLDILRQPTELITPGDFDSVAYVDLYIDLQRNLPRREAFLHWMRHGQFEDRIYTRKGSFSKALSHPRRAILDITTQCNLRCQSCNRSCGTDQAPGDDHMSAAQVERFLEESKAQGRQWEIIYLEGGEPTLHPELSDILDLLLEYRRSFSPSTVIKLNTNGFAKGSRRMGRDLIERGIDLFDSAKSNATQADHCAFNMAPMDDPDFDGHDFSQGCGLPPHYGIGLTRTGYYAHPICGGIDRVFGFDLGLQELPSPDFSWQSRYNELCPHCGYYRYMLNDTKEFGEGEMSESWKTAYARYREQKPSLSVYG